MKNEFAAQIIRKACGEKCRFRYSKHALERMQERDISRSDVRYILSRCRVTGIDEGHQGVSWNAEAKDIDGRPLRIVIREMTEDGEAVFVITVIEVNGYENKG